LTVVKPAILSLAVLMVMSAMLTSCGRKGDLDPPSLAVVDPAQPPKPAPPAENKKFFLDPLL